MFTESDLSTLRKQGMTNKEIMQMTSRVVPSAARALQMADKDFATPDSKKDEIFGRMLDGNAKRTKTSGLPYVAALQVNAAQKKNDAVMRSYEQKPDLLTRVTAPVRNAVGLGVMGLGKLTGADVSNVPEVKNFKEDVRMTADVLPAIAGIAGSSFGPAGTAVGTAGGSFIADRLRDSVDPNATPYIEQSMAGNVLPPIADGVVAGAADMAIRTGINKVASKLSGKVDPKTVQELVMPKAGQRQIQEAALKSPELVKKGGLFSKGSLLPDNSQKALIQAAESIPGFGQTDDVLTNMGHVDSSITQSSQVLRNALKANESALPRREIASLIDKAKSEALEAFGNEASASSQYQGIVNIWNKVSAKFPGTNAGQWEARIAFDDELMKQFGKKIFDPTLERPIHSAVRTVREVVNGAIDKASAGKFSPAIKEISNFYSINENLATKLGTDTLKSGVQKFFGSTAGKVTAGVAAGTAAAPLGINLLKQ